MSPLFDRRRKPVEPDASLLSGPLTTLSESAEEQIAYLAGRSREPDLSDLDVIQELAEEFGDGLELAMPALRSSKPALAGVMVVDESLRAPGLGADVAALRSDPGWARIREGADAALRLLRSEGLIPDRIPFRLYPTRFAPLLEPVIGSRDEWLALVLTQAEFDFFTEAWEQALPSSRPLSDVRVAQIQDAARQVYADYPEILQALGL